MIGTMSKRNIYYLFNLKYLILGNVELLPLEKIGLSSAEINALEQIDLKKKVMQH